MKNQYRQFMLFITCFCCFNIIVPSGRIDEFATARKLCTKGKFLQLLTKTCFPLYSGYCEYLKDVNRLLRDDDDKVKIIIIDDDSGEENKNFH